MWKLMWMVYLGWFMVQFSQVQDFEFGKLGVQIQDLHDEDLDTHIMTDALHIYYYVVSFFDLIAHYKLISMVTFGRASVFNFWAESSFSNNDKSFCKASR